jgi:hypothetical protein
VTCLDRLWTAGWGFTVTRGSDWRGGERQLKPGAMDEYQATMRASADSMGGPPPGMVEMMAMVDTADGDHLIQLGILRTDDPSALRQQNRGGREQMVERIAPYIESVGIDTTFELVEELAPSHA